MLLACCQDYQSWVPVFLPSHTKAFAMICTPKQNLFGTALKRLLPYRA